jgi:dihydroflavonol-4-reductase
MRVLVTGATGKVGNALAAALAGRGDDVRVLARDPEAAAEVLPDGVEIVRGDVTEPATVPGALEGRELVFNAMGLPEQWFPDEGIFDRVNATGSGNLARAAREAGVRRFVHTSTNDVFHAEQGATFDESELADYPKGTAYERSKQRAEELVLAEGVPPGGASMVYIDGVVQGHLAAAEKGKHGERYILSDAYTSMRDLAELVVSIAGRGRVPPTMPVPLAKAFAAGGSAVARIIRRPPMLTRGQLHYLLWQARADSSKAQRELGFTPTPLESGVRLTLEALGLAASA